MSCSQYDGHDSMKSVIRDLTFYIEAPSVCPAPVKEVHTQNRPTPKSMLRNAFARETRETGRETA